jgi:isocitrate/isopropylmalate dehydrogenase
MSPTLRPLLALAAAFASLTLGEAAMARGVYAPMHGSAPAVTGRHSVNPSAPASAINPSAHNLSAAPSAVTTLNALNRTATPSTFGGPRR